MVVATPHTPKTLAKFVAELRQQVAKIGGSSFLDANEQVRKLEEEKQEDFFNLSVARPELCSARTEATMMAIFHSNSTPIRFLDS